MSYAVSASLQAAVYQALDADAALAALVGDAVYDALPAGSLPPLYVVLGPEQVRDRSDKTGDGAEHDITVSVVTDETGFQAAKQAAGAVSDVLHGAALVLGRGRLVSLNFLKAAAKLDGTGSDRRIDLKFRARVADE